MGDQYSSHVHRQKLDFEEHPKDTTLYFKKGISEPFLSFFAHFVLIQVSKVVLVGSTL